MSPQKTKSPATRMEACRRIGELQRLVDQNDEERQRREGDDKEGDPSKRSHCAVSQRLDGVKSLFSGEITLSR